MASIAGFITFMISCHKSNIQAPAGTTTVDLPATTAKYYNSTTEGYNPGINDKATLGRVLFYDGHLSLNNAISCGSCHQQAMGFADGKRFSTGYEGRLTGRNSQSIANLKGTDTTFYSDFLAATNFPLFWDGRENIVKNLINRPITNHVEMGIDDPSVLPAKLASLSFYPPLFQKAYGDPNITTDRISECVAAFIVSIQAHNTKFDRYKAGDVTALNALETQGLNLFTTKYNCDNCHRVLTSNYYSSGFVDIGLDESYADKGNGNVTGNSYDYGKFGIPSLRNVALTGPYMHDGRFKTLNDVLEHYSHNIQNSPNLDILLKDGNDKARAMNISDQEKQALIAFLNTLTDYTMITDPKFSNPFKTK